MKKKILAGSVLVLGIFALAGCTGNVSNNDDSALNGNNIPAPAPSESAVPAPAPTQTNQKRGEEINDEIADLDAQINSVDLESDFGESNLSDSEIGL